MSGRLQGKVALITGGGTGIGAAIARRFANAGASIVVTGRRREPIEAIAAELDGLAVAGDTADENDCRAAVSATLQRFGGLDILIANAGIIAVGSITSQDPMEWQEILRINLSGVMQIGRAAVPAMTERGGGSIVNISSVAGIRAGGEFASYITSKHAVIGLTKSMAYDYGPNGIRVNALCPGWVKTPMSDEEMANLAERENISVEEATALTVKHLPLNRMADPDEIAACAEFLASDDASFVTGETLIADGGGQIVDVGTLAFVPDD
jgi:NAD(P)-dependent dehydrogenase (short-subunit alcohol dehydrogenase family)